MTGANRPLHRSPWPTRGTIPMWTAVTLTAVPTLALVRLSLSHDIKGEFPAPPVCVVGQGLTLNFWVTGFERDPKSKEPNVSFKMRVLEGGRSVLAKPPGGEVKTVPADYKMIP